MWYQFNQNNSGGSFVTDEMVCHRVFIEANSAEEANKIAIDMGIYFDGVSGGLDCGCCGDRWYEQFGDGISFPYDYGQDWKTKELLVFNNIEDYTQYLANKYGWTSPDARIYYADGKTVKEVFMQKEPTA